MKLWLKSRANRRVHHFLSSAAYRESQTLDHEHGDIEIKDYVILSNGEDNRIPPHTLMMDVTVTHDRYGRTLSVQTDHSHTVSSTGAPQSDDTLNNVSRIKIRLIVSYTLIDLNPSSLCQSP